MMFTELRHLISREKPLLGLREIECFGVQSNGTTSVTSWLAYRSEV